MNNYNLILGVIFIVLSFSSCDKNDNINTVNNDKQVIISADEYISAPSDQLTINSLLIISDSLLINFGASGCDGNTWELKLIDSGVILESYPPQRNLRLSLKNEEACLAYFIKDIAFDIKTLQVDGSKVLLNITNSDVQILYEY